jgi:hypothetical protein
MVGLVCQGSVESTRVARVTPFCLVGAASALAAAAGRERVGGAWHLVPYRSQP